MHGEAMLHTSILLTIDLLSVTFTFDLLTRVLHATRHLVMLNILCHVILKSINAKEVMLRTRSDGRTHIHRTAILTNVLSHRKRAQQKMNSSVGL